MEFLLLCVLVVLVWITVNRSIWLVQRVAARRYGRRGRRADVERLVRRECAHLDQEYRRLTRH